MNQNRIIDNTRNPRKFWVPNCLDVASGGFCEFIQYGKWETTTTSSTVTTRNINNINNGNQIVNVVGPNTVNDPFVPGTTTPTAALTGATRAAVNTAFGTPLPIATPNTLPTFPIVTNTILSDNTVTSSDGLVITRTIVTQMTRQSTTTWTVPIANVVFVAFGTDRYDTDWSRGLMRDRFNALDNTLRNPNNLLFDRQGCQFLLTGGALNQAYISRGVLMGNFTTVRTTTDITTTVITKSYNFMRNKDNPNNYIPTVNPIK